jgi:hypothetical protein
LKAKNALKLHPALDPLKGLKFEQFNKTNARWVLQKGNILQRKIP